MVLSLNVQNEEPADFGLGLANGLYDEKYAREWIINHI